MKKKKEKNYRPIAVLERRRNNVCLSGRFSLIDRVVVCDDCRAGGGTGAELFVARASDRKRIMAGRVRGTVKTLDQLSPPL